MTFTIISLTAAYALVAALLAYVLVLSRLHWFFKALGTIATAVLIPLTFNSIGELRGLPSDGPIPTSFRMLWAEVTEPNPLQHDRGNVFLWLQTLDAQNFPLGQPRAYQLPYSADLQVKVKDAMAKIAQGKEVQGEIDSKKALPKNTADDLAQEIQTGKVNTNGKPGGDAAVGDRILQFEPGMLTFNEEAAPITPAKPQ